MGSGQSASSYQPRLFADLFESQDVIDIPDMCGVLKLGIAPTIQLLKVKRYD